MPDDNEPSEDYEYDRPFHDLDDVCERLGRIEEAIKRNHWNIAPWIAGVIIYLGFVTLVHDMWFSKVRYSWWYGVSSDQVTIDKEPKDCDLFHSPIGDKGCHYKSRMNSILVKTDSSDLARGTINYVSYDNGITWNVDNSVPPTKPQITISWDKVEE